MRKLSLLGITGVAVYAFLIFTGSHWVGRPMGDLELAYQFWVNNGMPYGLSTDWVYPFIALLPMWLANAANPGHLELPWLFGCAILTVTSTLVIAGKIGTRRAFEAMYFWLGATLLLGPVAISRLDTVSVIFAVLAVFSLARRENSWTVTLLTFATWLKVWPLALLLGLFAALRRRWRALTAISFANLAVLAVAFLIGGNASVFSFLANQAGRGIQIEAPIADFWLWPAVFGSQGFGIRYSSEMMTFQVVGPNTEMFAALLSLVQIGALAITLALGWIGRRRGASFESVFFWVSFTAILDLIFFNKVGSPQYQTWLAVPVIYGLLVALPKMRTPVILVLVLSLLTWLIYPITYDGLLQGNWFATALLTLRNLVLLFALVYGNLGLQKLGQQRADNL